MKCVAIFLFVVCVCSCGKKYKHPHVEVQTRSGDIEIELFPDQAPKSVAAFLSNIDHGYYDHASFYRALNDDDQPTGNAGTALLQGGVWRTKGQMHIPGISHEGTRQTGLTHLHGTVSFARGAPGTAATEFFICIGDQKGLDQGGMNNPDGQGYAAFGRVVKGMDLVMRWYTAPTNGEMLEHPIEITGIVRL